LIQCLQMARHLVSAGKTVRMGAHVGETSSLTLAGLVFANMVNEMKEIEGAAGDNLLLVDPFQPSLKFGFQGKVKLDDNAKKEMCLQYDKSLVKSIDL